MGMYSFVRDFDLEVVDLDGLKNFLVNGKNFPEYKDKEWVFKYFSLNEDGSLSLDGMNDSKIITYWYTGTLMFLRDVALFVNGLIELDFETDSEFAKIRFEEGECEIEIGSVEWAEYSPEDIVDGESLPKCGFIERLKTIKNI